MVQQISIPVTDISQVGEARRAAARISAATKMDDTTSGRFAIIVTELATNLARYASRGEVVLSGTACSASGACEVLAIDRGPGMDSGRCLVDGFSTGGTRGHGLGAVQRLASEFDVFSTAAGTVILARVRRDERERTPTTFRWGCINLPAKDEQACGDTYRIYNDESGRAVTMIADGLGHGPQAAAASAFAVAAFDEEPRGEVSAFLEASHRAMAGSRGAAVAIASMDQRAMTLKYAGVGNIAGTVFTATERRGLPSQNGIVGAILPRLQSFEYPLPPSGVLVMHSDGLQTRWTLSAYPGLALRHPSVIAGTLLRDFYRGRDDVTIVVGAWGEGGS